VRYASLLLLAACQSPFATDVMHRFRDRAVAVARDAAPEASFVAEVEPVRIHCTSRRLPHTELITLRGRPDDPKALMERFELEAGAVLFESGMHVRDFRRGEPHTSRWIYDWSSGTGLLTLWGREQEGGDFIVAITIHESGKTR